MLYLAIIAAVLILAVALRFLAEGDDPGGNATVHHGVDEPRDDDEPDLMAAAA